MEINDMNKNEVIERLAALDEEVRKAQDVDSIEAAAQEKKELIERKAELEAIETRKQNALNISAGTAKVFVKEERKVEQQVQFDKETVRDTPEYRSAFIKKLQGKALTELEERAYITSDSGVAGAVIPTELANTIFDKMTKIAPMLNEITLLRVAGNLRFAVENASADAAIHTENAAVTPASDTLAYVDLAGFEYVKIQRISKTVSTMAIPAFEAWLSKVLAEDIAVQLENAIINGNGSGAPKGVEYARTWTNASTGIDFGDAVTYDHILNLIALLPARYDANAKFLMGKAMFYQQIMNIKDAEGNPIVARDFANAAQMKILGYPVIISDKVAASTAYLGDYSKVVGNLAQDITVDKSMESAFTSNAIDYRGAALFDCDIALVDAFVKLFT